MKKRMAPLIVLLSLLIVLFAGYFIMRGINERNTAKTEDTGSEESGIVLTVYQNANVRAIAFTNPDTTEKLTFESDGETWTLSGEPNFPVSQTKLTAMASATASVKAELQLNPDSGSVSADYGLDEPAYTITVSYLDEDETVNRTFIIGNYNEFNSCYYMSEEGSENIYMISSSFAETFDYTKKELVQTETKPKIDEESITSVEVSAGGSSRVEEGDGIEVISDLYDGLSTSQFLTWYADDDALKDAGLLEPAGTIVIHYEEETTVTDENNSSSATTVTNEKQVTLTLGGLYEQEAEGAESSSAKRYTCYRINESDFIYLMDESAAQTLLAFASDPESSAEATEG